MYVKIIPRHVLRKYTDFSLLLYLIIETIYGNALLLTFKIKWEEETEMFFCNLEIITCGTIWKTNTIHVAFEVFMNILSVFGRSENYNCICN